MTTMRLAWLLLMVSPAGCAPDLRVDHPFDGTSKCIDPATSAEVDCALVPLVSVTLDGEVRHAIIDATNEASKVYFDLDLGKELKSDEAFATNAWDLAFKRFEISLNGGASNPPGRVRAAVLEGMSFESLTQAPAEGYQQDGAQTVFSQVNGGWYYYNLATHKLITKDQLYVIQTSEGAYVKLRMGSYYDAAGTRARISLSYAPVAAP